MLSGFGTTESLMTATTGKINFQVGSNHDDLQTLDMNIYENDKSGPVEKNVNNAKGYALENLMSAAGISDANAKFKVDKDGAKKNDGDYTVFN